MLCDMPSADHVWGSYLRRHGFKRKLVPEECCTVAEFAEMFPHGCYILAISGHVVYVRDGEYIDSWDSGEEIPIYYWQKDGEN